jgi:hypothetical protein
MSQVLKIDDTYTDAQAVGYSVHRSTADHNSITFCLSCCFCEPEGVSYNILFCLDL